MCFKHCFSASTDKKTADLGFWELLFAALFAPAAAARGQETSRLQGERHSAGTACSGGSSTHLSLAGWMAQGEALRLPTAVLTFPQGQELRGTAASRQK